MIDLQTALRLEGRTALVTGGARGIGRGISKLLAAAGASVVVADADRDGASETVAEIKDLAGTARSEELDVASAASIARLRERMDGPVSVLVNNAGISGQLPLDDPEVEALWDRHMAVNLDGPFRMARAFAPALRQTRGCIVNIASAASFHAVTGSFSYVSSKGGVRSLTQVLAKELARDGVRVNAVAPGGIDTAMMARRKHDAEWMGMFGQRTAMGRLGTPEEVACAVLFLVSPLSAYITGTVLPVDGGFLAG
ncbi:SDR family oxidoreductase [Ramlibacter sp. G-1-2-2]|uniref:SDR family oxidoreductase n=1 Tax=Ramlibacter agri TaxID=2728837 RepID=A0A848H8W7_9BURK|nr:SDR family oxidoreductase [Ramlibacter agri]NML46402.1 SDR family oxidoreductase [Ramlibacter agri]